MRKECRAKVSAEATPEAMHAAFQRLFPMPCRSRYVALCLLPQQPLLARLVCCPCCLFPYAFTIPCPQPWPLLPSQKVHVGETSAMLSREKHFQNTSGCDVQASASQRVLPSRDKSTVYWVTTAVIVAGALAGLAFLRRR